jgi:membrane-bound lytic murein transglycosylase D
MAAQLARAGREPGVNIATGVPSPMPAPVPEARTHSVRPGENLVAIARAYSCDLKELARANRLEAPTYTVRTGLVLRLEGCGR